MSTPTDQAAVVQTFLNAVECKSCELTELFKDVSALSGGNDTGTPSLRVRGLLMKLAEQEKECDRKLEFERGKVVHESISKRGNIHSSTHLNEIRRVSAQSETNRSNLREKWFKELTPKDVEEIDALYLAVAAPILSPYFPHDLPASLHGPLTRLAMECAGIARRAERERERIQTSQPRENRTIVNQFLAAFQREQKEVTDHVIGQWFLEVPDSSAQTPAPRRRIPKDEANILVRDWLIQNAKKDPDCVKIDMIVNATGVSRGQIPNLPSWRAFEDERKKRRGAEPRIVQTSDPMIATIGVENDPASQERLDETIDSQMKDQKRDNRNPRSRRS